MGIFRIDMANEKSLPKAFIENVKKRRNEPFLFYKVKGQWLPVSWTEVGVKVRFMALGLVALGVQKGDRISPISNTTPEMAYCCLAIAASGAIFTAIYHTNGPKECAHVLNDCGARCAFAEDRLQFEKLKSVWRDCPNLERIIVFKKDWEENDSRVLSLDQLIALGRTESNMSGDRAYYERMESITVDDPVAIIYTSGTTGPPKGVIFNHRGIIRNLTEQTRYFPIVPDEKGIGYLPMAHAIELMDGHWRHVLFGFPHVYAQSMQTLLDDVRETRPTFFFTTPRFYEKHYQRFMSAIDALPTGKKSVINWCLSIGARYQDTNDQRRNSVWLAMLNSIASFIYFKKVKEAISSELRWSSSGGAPIPATILHFYRSCGIPIYEGFGLTESQGLISLNRPGAWKIGTVGKPMDGIEVSFANDGELLVRGWARCAGYWKNAEATEELFKDGWLHTGDLAFLDEDGFMHINGRKKELIITSTGKNIAPLNIQNLLKSSPYIAEAVVFGEAKTYLTALITLDEEKITAYAREIGIQFANTAELERHPAITGLIAKEIETKNQDLARIEQIKKFTILEDQFRQDRDELTPTMKVKRRVVEQRYKDKIEAMYEK
jgi:long-chain acyl-CoA synthetase